MISPNIPSVFVFIIRCLGSTPSSPKISLILYAKSYSHCSEFWLSHKLPYSCSILETNSSVGIVWFMSKYFLMNFNVSEWALTFLRLSSSSYEIFLTTSINEPSSLRLDFANVLRLVLLSIERSRGKQREMACYKGTRRGEEETLSCWGWGLVVYLRGLTERRLLSLTNPCLFLFLGVRLGLSLEEALEWAQLVKS